MGGQGQIGGHGQQGGNNNVLQFESDDYEDDYSLIVKSPEDGPVGPNNYPQVPYGSPDVGLYDGPSSTSVTGTVGATVELPCPLPEADDTTWQKTGAEIPVTAFHLRGMLRIPYVNEVDAGSYMCSSGGRTAIVVLTVERAIISHSPPEITIKPSSTGGVYIGDYVDVRCLVAGAPRSSNIIWTKENGSFALNVKSTKGLLRFDSIALANGGKYRCTVETPGGTFTEDYDLVVKG